MYANLNNDGEQIITGNDSIVIKACLDEIEGGRTLDVSGFSPEVINAGHPILRKDSADKQYAPMPVKGLGAIATIGKIVGGSAYTNNATYTGVDLTGGSGSGAKATIIVDSNAVTSVAITTPGTGYAAGDSLSAAASEIGTAGSGFLVGVASVSAEAVAYDTKPAGYSYVGFLKASVLTAKPFAGILVRGTINSTAAPYDLATIQSAIFSALPLIQFRED